LAVCAMMTVALRKRQAEYAISNTQHRMSPVKVKIAKGGSHLLQQNQRHKRVFKRQCCGPQN